MIDDKKDLALAYVMNSTKYLVGKSECETDQNNDKANTLQSRAVVKTIRLKD